MLDDNYFKFRDKIYKQTEGTCMGSCLSPLIADIFMKTLETKLQSSSLFPKVWLRYVDDIFVIIEKSKITDTLNWLNDQHGKIRFTMEEESDGLLPFLDVLVNRQSGTLTFDVYRKPTSTSRYITSDSFHHQSQKNAAFHAMAHRLCNFNLSDENYEREKKKIIEIGRLNGYQSRQIDKIIRKHEKLKVRRDITTLNETRPKEVKRISVPYYPIITNKLNNVLQRNNIKLVTSSNDFKTKNNFISTKDQRTSLQKSGIYEVKCGTSNCEYKYIGQSRRSIKTRFGEHRAHTENNKTNLSSVANHMRNKLNGGPRLCTHKFGLENLKLLKSVPNSRKLDAYESIFLHRARRQKLMNDERQKEGNIKSTLFQFIDY
jgi:hypothetical protein